MKPAPDPRPDAGTLAALMAAQHGDPFSVLGPHRLGEGWALRSLLPGGPALSAYRQLP